MVIMRKNMMPPLPEIPGETPQDRFRRFGKALLAVRKSEITPLEETISRLESHKQKIDAKIAEVERSRAKGKKPKRTSKQGVPRAAKP
jgi:hypothetical protein